MRLIAGPTRWLNLRGNFEKSLFMDVCKNTGAHVYCDLTRTVWFVL